ncbi:MAG: iron donor protein CyaY [Rickettsiales bacterium]|nr:iron donor protein CyaY [Rickettsiales bacterium]
MMTESEFHSLADCWLAALAQALEDADSQAALEIDYQVGIVTIETAAGKTFIVSKHGPSQQIWLSSPLSGGLHFPYHAVEKDWILPDGRRLKPLLSTELATLAGVEFT